MTADIINLRRARKAKLRDGRTATAETNRVVFGRTKAEKTRDKAERKRAEQTLAGHKVDSDNGGRD